MQIETQSGRPRVHVCAIEVLLNSFYCLHRNYMKRLEELLIGVLLFYIVDRGTRLISSVVSHRRNMSDIETEKFRCTVETSSMLVLFAFLWFRLKKTGRL
jgi:hypothetical protein